MKTLHMIGVISEEMKPCHVPADGLVPEGWVVRGEFMFPPKCYQLLLWKEPPRPVYSFDKAEDRASALRNGQVAMPTFGQYPESLVRELQAAFEYTCKAVGLDVVYDDAKNLSKNLRTPTGRLIVPHTPAYHQLPKE